MRDVRWFEVGALHEPDVQPVRDQPLEVGGRAKEVGLQDDADVVVSVVAQALVEVERRRDARALLHVDLQAHAELKQAARALEHQLVVELDAQVRELERHVGVKALFAESGDLAGVFRLVRIDLGRGQRVVVEEPGQAPHALRVAFAEDGDDLVEGLGGDEAAGAEPHSIARHEAIHARALGRAKNGGAREH